MPDRVRVLDCSTVQLERDRETAARYGVAVRAMKGGNPANLGGKAGMDFDP